MGEKIMTQPKVSVVIPIWNTEKYLEKCLESLVNQTLKDIEIICVNNGSTDSCPQIIDRFARNDSRIKVVNKEHGCLSSARNAGMDIATAPYLTFVDSDDWVEAQCYKLAVAEFEKDSEVDLVCWGANIINVDLDENSQYIKGARNYHRIKITGKQPLTDKNLDKMTVCIWNKLFKTNIIRKNDVKYPLNIELEDNSFFYTYIVNCKYAYFLDHYFYNYVQRKNSSFEKIVSGESDICAPRLKNLKYITQYYINKNLFKEKQNLVIEYLKNWLRNDYNNAKSCNKTKVIEIAIEIAKLFENSSDNFFINMLKKQKINIIEDYLINKKILLFGSKNFGLYQELYNPNRYKIKIFKLKINFKFGGE